MTKAGSYTLAATSTGLTGATSNIFSITPAAASKLAFASAVVSGQASSAATLGPLTVQRQDQFNNPTTTGGAITVALASDATATAKFSATSGGTAVTSVSLASGSASTDVFYGDTKAASPTITASSTGLTSATQQETITAAAASSLQFVNCILLPSTSIACTGTIAMGNNSNVTFNMRTVDTFGNPSSPAAATSITFANSDSTNFSITAGAPASITSPATQSAQVTQHHNNSNTSDTLTAHASPGTIADATLAATR
jgi:hypothetical protein